MKSIIKKDYTSLIALDAIIESSMKTIRVKRVMLSSDVAKLYHVTPEYLHKQVNKNIDCFPKDFMFKLNAKEQVLFKGEKFPYVYTEQGILMAGGKLNSHQAIKIHMQLISYFIQLFDQAIKDMPLMEKLQPLIGDEKIFKILKEMIKENKTK